MELALGETGRWLGRRLSPVEGGMAAKDGPPFSRLVGCAHWTGKIQWRARGVAGAVAAATRRTRIDT